MTSLTRRPFALRDVEREILWQRPRPFSYSARMIPRANTSVAKSFDAVPVQLNKHLAQRAEAWL